MKVDHWRERAGGEAGGRQHPNAGGGGVVNGAVTINGAHEDVVGVRAAVVGVREDGAGDDGPLASRSAVGLDGEGVCPAVGVGRHAVDVPGRAEVHVRAVADGEVLDPRGREVGAPGERTRGGEERVEIERKRSGNHRYRTNQSETTCSNHYS